ncbi:MAG: D-glycero-beta-D-manno-heptose-7-phosphate kinase [Bacteroidales bacterium]|nr:D-glycero-beta-D-manno-heptose-7-phosphate kinase [Bacteroidales bacterium]
MADTSSIFEKISSKKVIVVGDVMIDSYMLGNVNRISPEAPVPIVSVSERKYRLGGAANVALNIASFGATVYLCSVIGNDAKGKIFRQLLRDNNLPDSGIISSENRTTTTKTRIISGSQHLLRIDEEDDSQISDELRELVLSRISQIIDNEQIDALIFEDYDKGILSPELIHKITALCRQNKIKTTVDPKKRNFNAYKDITLFKPNLKEFCEGCKIEKTTDIEALKPYAKEFLHKNNFDILMITLSENGILICTRKDFTHIPAEIRDIVDVSGAGDTVISVASLLLTTTENVREIARIANIAGGIVCEKVGVVPIDLETLKSKI